MIDSLISAITVTRGGGSISSSDFGQAVPQNISRSDMSQSEIEVAQEEVRNALESTAMVAQVENNSTGPRPPSNGT